MKERVETDEAAVPENYVVAEIAEQREEKTRSSRPNWKSPVPGITRDSKSCQQLLATLEFRYTRN